MPRREVAIKRLGVRSLAALGAVFGAIYGFILGLVGVVILAVLDAFVAQVPVLQTFSAILERLGIGPPGIFTLGSAVLAILIPLAGMALAGMVGGAVLGAVYNAFFSSSWSIPMDLDIPE